MLILMYQLLAPLPQVAALHFDFVYLFFLCLAFIADHFKVNLRGSRHVS
jgi:hypothetical protein